VLRQPAATATESWLDELGRGAGRRERAGRSVWLAVASSSRLGSPGCCLLAPPSGMGACGVVQITYSQTSGHDPQGSVANSNVI
jgi:hypothetical protein